LVIKFGFSANPADVAEVTDAARQAEALGFDRIGVWDSPALYREPWVTLAAVAVATRRVELGTWVTNPLTRHPVVTASAAATLDDLAPGRVVIGIGTGDSGVYGLGGTASPLAHLASYVTTVRTLLRDGVAEWQGARVTLPWAGPRRVRIIVAAHGAKAIRVAAAVGDGAVLGLGISPDVVARCLSSIADAGRDPDTFETWWTAPWYVAPDGEAARTEALWHVASLAHHIARRGVAGKFIPPQYADGVLELGARYDLGTHGAPTSAQRSAYAALARSLGVADYLVERFTIAGTPAEAAEQVRRIAAAGATRLDCANDSAPGHLLDRPRAWATSVLPLL
jgi:5,10-methylenetetrahydromethanopterin reductase